MCRSRVIMGMSIPAAELVWLLLSSSYGQRQITIKAMSAVAFSYHHSPNITDHDK